MGCRTAVWATPDLHSLGSVRRFTSVLCAVLFLLMGIAHLGHINAVAPVATTAITTSDAGENDDASSMADRIACEMCHCAGAIAWPVVTTTAVELSPHEIPAARYWSFVDRLTETGDRPPKSLT